MTIKPVCKTLQFYLTFNLLVQSLGAYSTSGLEPPLEPEPDSAPRIIESPENQTMIYCKPTSYDCEVISHFIFWDVYIPGPEGNNEFQGVHSKLIGFDDITQKVLNLTENRRLRRLVIANPNYMGHPVSGPVFIRCAGIYKSSGLWKGAKSEVARIDILKKFNPIQSLAFLHWNQQLRWRAPDHTNPNFNLSYSVSIYETDSENQVYCRRTQDNCLTIANLPQCESYRAEVSPYNDDACLVTGPEVTTTLFSTKGYYQITDITDSLSSGDNDQLIIVIRLSEPDSNCCQQQLYVEIEGTQNNTINLAEGKCTELKKFTFNISKQQDNHAVVARILNHHHQVINQKMVSFDGSGSGSSESNDIPPPQFTIDPVSSGSGDTQPLCSVTVDLAKVQPSSVQVACRLSPQQSIETPASTWTVTLSTTEEALTASRSATSAFRLVTETPTPSSDSVTPPQTFGESSIPSSAVSHKVLTFQNTVLLLLAVMTAVNLMCPL